MPFQIVREPIAGPLSFARSDDAAILTQAAVLLAIGAQLRGDNKRFRVASGGPAASATIPDEELKLLGLPPLGESLGRIDSKTRASPVRKGRSGCLSSNRTV